MMGLIVVVMSGIIVVGLPLFLAYVAWEMYKVFRGGTPE